MKYGDIELTGSLSSAISGSPIELLSSIVPDTSGTLSLGTPAAPFKELHVINQKVLVRVHYTTNSGQVISADSSNIQWEDKVIDTHDAWVTDTFTAPRDGTYHISATISPTNTSIPAMYARIGSTTTKWGSVRHPTANTAVEYNDILTLSQGDQVTFRLDASGTAATAAGRSSLQIVEAQ